MYHAAVRRYVRMQPAGVHIRCRPSQWVNHTKKDLGSTKSLNTLAERVGFEPTVPCGITGFQDQLLKPLGHLSKTSSIITAEYALVKCLIAHGVLRHLLIFSSTDSCSKRWKSIPAIKNLLRLQMLLNNSVHCGSAKCDIKFPLLVFTEVINSIAPISQGFPFSSILIGILSFDFEYQCLTIA